MTISGLDVQSQRFLRDLQRIQGRAEEAQRQISSGLRVSRPSDAPADIAEILQVRAELERSVQVKANMERVQVEVNTAERVVQEGIKLLERAKVLASAGAGTMVSAQKRTMLAGEVAGIHEQLVQISRTVVDGRYIFSGDRDQEVAYVANPAAPTGVVRQFLQTATREVSDVNGSVIRTTLTAQDIFDARNPDDSVAADNAFAAVHALRVALETDDTGGVDAAIVSLGRALERMNQKLSFYGVAQNRMADAVNQASARETEFKTLLGARVDADLAAAITEFTLAQTQLQATLATQAKQRRPTLFEILG